MAQHLVAQYRLVSIVDHAPINSVVYATFDEVWSAAMACADRGIRVNILCGWEV